MALSADRNTPFRDGEVLVEPVAAAKECFAGGIAVANSSGYVEPGTTATTLTYLGRFDEHADNSGGANGDVEIRIRRGKAFKWANDATDPVDQTMLGKAVYIVDDETVAKTDGTTTRSAAGICVGLDDDGVWVE